MTTCRILIVDDNQGVRESIACLLELEGYLVSTAVDGYDALEKLKEDILPCSILLDMTMPRMGGEKCLKKIRSHSEWRDIPVTLFSATRQCHIESMPHNVDYLQKPCEMDNLLANVKKHCG